MAKTTRRKTAPKQETPKETLPPAAENVTEARIAPEPEPEPEVLCAETGPEGPVGEEPLDADTTPVEGVLLVGDDVWTQRDEPETDGPRVIKHINTIIDTTPVEVAAPVVAEPEPAPAPVQDVSAELRLMESNRALRLQVDAQAKALERKDADDAAVRGDDTIPERTFFFRSSEGTIILSSGTMRWDQQMNRLVVDRPAVYAKFHGNLWKTTSRYKAMLMEQHMSFKNGKVKDHGLLKLNRRKFLKAQLDSLDAQGNAIGAAPASPELDLGAGGAPSMAGFDQAAMQQGDFSLPPLTDSTVPILPRGVVCSTPASGARR